MEDLVLLKPTSVAEGQHGCWKAGLGCEQFLGEEERG